MEPIADEWIDRLFGLMSEFYGDRWNRLYPTKYKLAMFKTIWKNGLHGLDHSQIKKALYYYRGRSKREQELPPLVTEFYHKASDVHPSA